MRSRSPLSQSPSRLSSSPRSPRTGSCDAAARSIRRRTCRCRDPPSLFTPAAAAPLLQYVPKQEQPLLQFVPKQEQPPLQFVPKHEQPHLQFVPKQEQPLQFVPKQEQPSDQFLAPPLFVPKQEQRSDQFLAPPLVEPNSYEEQRRRRMEENKHKLDKLRLHHLSAAVEPVPAKKLRYPRAPQPPTRRSGRVAGLPNQPDYRDINVLRGTYVQRESPPDRVHVADEARAYAFTKAEDLKNQLCSDHPSFIKGLTHSYATGSWLGIPPQFRKRHLSPCEMIILLDEEDVEFQILYSLKGGGLGSGWNRFATSHKLADGDCLVFQLVERRTFKVYIIRASSYYNKEH